jgi:murein DD-endopeptidase MepM/ murein hydrolase activator NlpD
MHWLDNLLLELASIILWFNPLMIWFKRAVKTQHEFLADQAAVNEYPDVHAYMIYLLKTSMSDYRLSVTSHFESNTIKQRIIMLTKNKTPRQYAIIYSLAIPAMAIILFAFQGSDPAKNAAGVDRPTTEYASVVTTQDVPSGAPIDRSEVQKLFLFGERMNTSTNKMQHHSGLDFVTRAGIKVMATADGIVSEAKFDEIKGNYIVIKHSDEFATQYFHLQSLDVKAGAVLKKGEAIGRVGNTGLSAGSHLHYEVLQHGNAVDPIDFVPEEIKEIVK